LGGHGTFCPLAHLAAQRVDIARHQAGGDEEENSFITLS
jgi:hypothetical protein